MNLFEMHEKLTGHLFPSYSNQDERFLALAICGEAGELANLIKKRWRDGVDLSEEVKDEIADIRVYLELLAKCFGIEGEKLDQRCQQKLLKVAEKHKARLQAGKCPVCAGSGIYQPDGDPGWKCGKCGGSGIVAVLAASG